MADIVITEYTDPGCPWAYSAEPFRWRLNWLYGNQLEWRVRMVGLASTGSEMEEKGFTTDVQAQAHAEIAAEHGMPIDTRERPRMAGTMPACRAVVAARRHAPEAERELLRRLRTRNFADGVLDDPELIAGAARDAGLDPAELAAWAAEPATEVALGDDMDAARRPLPAALALDHKLAPWSGGRRYTCPSYVFGRPDDEARMAVPGFQPFAAYEVTAANLAPGLERRATPESVEEVLAWAGTPLATQEVAVVCDIAFADARERLGRVAVEQHVGSDGFWTLPA